MRELLKKRNDALNARRRRLVDGSISVRTVESSSSSESSWVTLPSAASSALSEATSSGSSREESRSFIRNVLDRLFGNRRSSVGHPASFPSPPAPTPTPSEDDDGLPYLPPVPECTCESTSSLGDEGDQTPPEFFIEEINLTLSGHHLNSIYASDRFLMKLKEKAIQW